LAANIVAPITVVVLMYAGAVSVQDSRDQVAVAQAARDEAIKQMNDAVAAKQTAEAEKGKIETAIEDLRKEKARVEQENKKLLSEADPKAVVARVKRELGGQTSRIRSDSLYKQGRDAYAAPNLTLAYELYLAARDEDPSYVWPHVGLGNVAVDRKDFHVAEKHFKRAVAAAPDEPDATYNLASVEARLKRWGEAEKYARRTLELDPAYKAANRLLGEIAEARGRKR